MPVSTVLLTGASGFIGSPVREALVAAGYRVLSYDKRLGQDVLDRDLLAAALREVDAVVHLASSCSSVMFDEDRELHMQASLQGLKNITEQWHGLLIFPSTGTLYGDSADPVPETALLPSPRNAYALCKLRSEEICHDFAARGSRAITLRIFTGYGPRDLEKGAYSSAVAQLARSIASGDRPVVYGDGTQLRDFVHVQDIVQAILLALRSEVSWGLFNVGTGRGASFLEMLQIVSAHLGRTVEPIFLPRPLGYVRCTIADVSNARRVLGYEPRWAFAAGVADALGPPSEVCPAPKLAS